MMRWLILLVLLAVSVMGAPAPTGYVTWADSAAQIYTVQFGGEIQNYWNGTNWDTIRTAWQTEGTNKASRLGLLQSVVTAVGVCSLKVAVGSDTVIVVTQPIRMYWLDTLTKDTIRIFGAPSLANPTVSGDTVKFNSIWPGQHYWIVMSRSRLQQGFIFTKAFLDSLTVLYGQRADSARIALCHILSYKLVNVDSSDYTGEREERQLRQLGPFALKMARQFLQEPDGDTVENQIGVRQRWLRKGSNYFCGEFVMAKALVDRHREYPNKVLWHNATYSVGGGTNDGDFAMIDLVNADSKYGTQATASVGGKVQWSDYGGEIRKRVLIKWPTMLATIYGGTVTAATLSVDYGGRAGTNTFCAKLVKRPWVEADVTWNSTGTESWGTAGCLNTSTDLYDNTSYSCKQQTAVVDTGSNGRYDFDVATALQLCDQTDTANGCGGFMIANDTITTALAANIYFNTDEYATNTTLRPTLVVTYTPAVTDVWIGPYLHVPEKIPRLIGPKAVDMGRLH